jgi:hypothetical protein
MKRARIIIGACALFLLGVSIYFYFTKGYTEANFSTSKGFKKGDAMEWRGLFFLFLCMAFLYIQILKKEKKDKEKANDY